MRIELTNTTASKVAGELVRVREEGGMVALGRVLTLIVMAKGAKEAEKSIEATNDASHEHPSRVIVIDIDPGNSPVGSPTHSLDAEIRVGADAGASEVVLLRPYGEAATSLDTLVTPLLLPDTPIVAMWAGWAPDNPSATPVGKMAGRRITDITGCRNANDGLVALAKNYQPGDTDLAWARITLWRALLVSALEDQTDFVRALEIKGDLSRPSVGLLAGWLRNALGVPVTTVHTDAGHLEAVRATFDDGELLIDRPKGTSEARISRTGRRDQNVNLPVRPFSDCLMEDLRRLDADEVYATALAAAVTE